MDSQVPASFIPKKTYTPRPAEMEGAGFLFVVSVFFFAISLIAAGAVLGYKSYLTASIANKTDSLVKNQNALDFSAIEDLVRLDSRMNQAKRLLTTHVAPSAIFDFLSQQTLQNVQFTSFEYQLQSNGSAVVTLNGVADSFSTVALQSDQFGNSKVLKDVIFSNINTDPTGAVIFTVKTTIDPKLFLYTNVVLPTQNINSVSTTSLPATTNQQSASTSQPVQ